MYRWISLFAIALLPGIALAAPPSSPYAPGETLAPSCDPGDTNCTVTAPPTTTGTPTAGSLTYWDSSTTLAEVEGISWDETDLEILGNIQIAEGKDLQIFDDDGSDYLAFTAPSTLSGSLTWTLPDGDGTSGQVLTTDGSGALSWEDVSGITLSDDTDGNYVASVGTSVLTGLTGGAAGSEGTALTLAFDYSQALSGNVALGAGTAVFGQNGLVFEGSSADDFETFLAITNPTADRSITFPDESLTVNAAADISGSTLASNVVDSSLTSVGTLDSLSVSGAITGTSSLDLASTSGDISLTAGTTSSSDQVSIGNSGTATPDLLVLDNGTGDPTGIEGGMYYNSGDDKFRCYENSAWTDCIESSGGSGSEYFAGKQSDQSITSTTTLTDVDDLSFPVQSGETWAFSYELYITNNDSGQPDLQTAILGASGWSCGVQMYGNENNGSNFPEAATTDCDDAPTAMVNGAIGGDNGNGISVHIMGTITATSDGDAVLQFAQDTSSTNPLTVKAGSNVQAFRTAGADVAETYYSVKPLTPGTVVSIDGTAPSRVKKSAGIDDENVLGVVSTRPGLIIGGSGAAEGFPAFIALSGRVPVRVSLENGQIEPGDFLAASSTPGVAMRSDGSGHIIGQALEAFDDPNGGQVMMFVRYGSGVPGSSTNLSNPETTEESLFDIVSRVRSEPSEDPISALERLLAAGNIVKNVFTESLGAVSGYFYQTFADTSHQHTLCIGDIADEVCIDKTDLEMLLGQREDESAQETADSVQSPEEENLNADEHLNTLTLEPEASADEPVGAVSETRPSSQDAQEELES